ncbi:MAG: carboxylesterase family protein [Parasporobacterium sp.]|nr:carboxylesterase family protein [Parasporobacterium sp.]
MLRKVKTENGWVEGIEAADPRITAFKGVPYAAPPVGENRWRAPQPCKDWEGVLKAYRFAPISMQHIPGEDVDNLYSREWNVDPTIEQSEDSLVLNIWTPAKSADEKLPVFVWYFGGGLREGSTAEMEFDGERLARRGIIVVTVNYRLAAFGFLCHPEITKESPEFPGNFGYLDQRFGTMWVKRNIAAFGGDPDNITIGGQSAGGGSVMAQMASPLNKGLFNRCIVDSGLGQVPYPPSFFRPPLSIEEAEKEGEKFFEELGVKTLEEARALDAFYIRDKMAVSKARFAVINDGNFLVKTPDDAFMANEGNIVPVLFGHTSSEFPSAPPASTVAEFKEYAEKTFGADAPEFLKLCESKTGSIKEMMYKAQVQHLEYSVRLVGRKKAASGNRIPMYYWVFDPEIPGWDNPGTFHSSDLWFFFETLAKCWRPFVGKHYDLARLMCNYWANFIKCGDPNGKDANGEDMPFWAPYTDENPTRMWFGDTAYTENKGPSELVEFLLKNGMK